MMLTHHPLCWRWASTETIAPNGMQLGMTPNAQDHGVEGGAILPITDVMQLESLLRLALLATVSSTDQGFVPNRGTELTS
jgi:hypothetical protein